MAELAKFLSERIHTAETINDMEKVASKMSAQTRESSAVRKTLEMQTQIIRNSADTILKGVVVIYEDVNPKEKYVKVMAGFNYKTMKAADTAKLDLNLNLADPVYPDSELTEEDSSGDNSSGSSTQRKIRKSQMYQDFYLNIFLNINYRCLYEYQ